MTATGRIVIVGAGHGGATAAVEVRKRGYEGEVVLLSDEGGAPYERPPLSKSWLTGEGARKPPLFDEATLADRGVRYRPGVRATGLDRAAKALATDDGPLAYDRLVLATGSRARRLAVPGAALPGVHVLRTAADADGLRAALSPGARIVVVGAGYVGLEVAASARRLGASVTVVEMAPRVMARTASEPISAHYRAAHEASGVRFVFGDGLARVDGAERAEGVTLASGRTLAADAVLIAVGGVPETALAADAGLDCDDGIVVNPNARTSDPSVYAVGDATRRPCRWADRPVRLESVHNALEQARLAAAAITGTAPPRIEAPWFWSDQYDMKLQIAGLVRPGADLVVRRSAASVAVFHLAGERLLAVEAVNDPRSYMTGRKALNAGSAVDASVLADPAREVTSALR